MISRWSRRVNAVACRSVGLRPLPVLAFSPRLHFDVNCGILPMRSNRDSDPGSGLQSTPSLFIDELVPEQKVKQSAMRRHPIVSRLWEELEQTAQSLGFELVQATFGGPLGNQSLTVYVDREAGVSADDCAALAEQFSVLLDTLDPIGGSYNLVVSSPGLDRPLGRDEDFEKYAGERAVVRHLTAGGKTRRTRGRLMGVQAGRVVLQTEGHKLELPLEQITAANLEYDWDDTGAESAGAPQ